MIALFSVSYGVMEFDESVVVMAHLRTWLDFKASLIYTRIRDESK